MCLADPLRSLDAAPPGFLEGHLKDRFAQGSRACRWKHRRQTTAENLRRLSTGHPEPDGKQEIARVTADASGNYRVALPPGDYILDVQGRHLRARPRETATVHGCFKPNRPRRYGYRHRRSLMSSDSDSPVRDARRDACELTNKFSLRLNIAR